MRSASSPLAPPLTPAGYVGYLVRNTRHSGFKLALIVGPTGPTYYADRSDRVRVRFWRAASSCWTQPTLVERQYLQALAPEEVAGRRRLIAAAGAAAIEQKIVNATWT